MGERREEPIGETYFMLKRTIDQTILDGMKVWKTSREIGVGQNYMRWFFLDGYVDRYHDGAVYRYMATQKAIDFTQTGGGQNDKETKQIHER